LPTFPLVRIGLLSLALALAAGAAGPARAADRRAIERAYRPLKIEADTLARARSRAPRQGDSSPPRLPRAGTGLEAAPNSGTDAGTPATTTSTTTLPDLAKVLPVAQRCAIRSRSRSHSRRAWGAAA
jgi:hypothetical protein